MQKIILIGLIFWCLSLRAQDSKYISSYVYYEVGQVIHLFGNNVHLRDAPHTSSSKIAVLPIGSTLKVLEETERRFDNYIPFWLKVKYNNQVGYIRSDFIAMQNFELDGVPHFARLGGDAYKLILQIRIPTKREPAYIEKEFEVFSSDFKIEPLDNRGLKNVHHIIHLDYISEACGVDGGGQYIFVDNSNQWIDAFTYSQISDAGIFYWWEELKFPNEHQKGDYILYTSDYFEVIDEGDDYENPNHTEKHLTQRKLYWDGKQLYPKFQQLPLPPETMD